MTKLLLENLDISNFRTFAHLRVEHLGRVNLITGKNNVGKSSLLEALWLFARGGTPDTIMNLLIDRDEISTQHIRETSTSATANEAELFDHGQYLDSIKYLFHDYQLMADMPPLIYIGSIETDKKQAEDIPNHFVMIEIIWYHVQEDADEVSPPRYVKINPDQRSHYEDAALYFVVRTGSRRFRFKLERFLARSPLRSLPYEIPSQFVKTSGLSAIELSDFWNDIQLTDAEEAVLEAVRLIDPSIERISVRSEQGSRGKPVPIIRRKGSDEPVPLRVLGDGINRLFGLTLALVNARNGLLLIDEIENGIHYSILPQLWRFIFQAASRFNVQVFATTHSLDCIQSFQEAAEETPDDGMLIRLKERNGTVAATVLTEDEVGFATQDGIELR